VDEDIAKTQELIEATEKLKRGLMQELFTHGIGHTKFKDVKLGKLCEFKYGFSLPETKREKGHIPVYGSNGKVGYHKVKSVSGPLIIIGRKGTIGAITWSDVDCWPIDTTYYVENGNYDLKWLYYLLIYLRLNKMNTASGTPGLNRDEAYSRNVNVPSQNEQQKIADILSSIDEKISVNKKLKEKLILLKKGLMRDLLSGRVRVNI
jgi:type I restriction enzyme S subunit